jgi:sulfatase modifying factor 1
MSKFRAAIGASLLLLLTGCGARTSLELFGPSGSGNGSGSGTIVTSSGSRVTSGTTIASGVSSGVGVGVSSGTIAVASGFNASGSVFSGSLVSVGFESGASSGVFASAGAFGSGTVASSGTTVYFCPGTSICLGNSVEVCSPSPLDPPGPPVACPPNTTCIAGVCTGVCGPGQRNCIGNTTQTCDNGQWQDDIECGGGTVCTGGVCIPETTAGACSTYCMTEPGCPPQSCYAVSANPVPAPGLDSIPDDKLLPQYAVDGNLATRYSSGQTQMGGEWFQVDLCQEKVVDGITVQDDDDPTDVAAAYTVQVSPDGRLWVTVAESAQPAPVDLVVSFPAILARYVRYNQTGSTINTPIQAWFSIDELNVQCAYTSDAGFEVESEGGVDEASYAGGGDDAVDGGSVDATSGGVIDDATSGGVIDDAASYGMVECTGNGATCVSVPASCWSSGPGVSDCGANGESCCTSYEVFGGSTFYRTYTSDSDGGATGLADPAFVSTFLLDKYDVTVGRFRPFVAAWNAGFRPAPGSGKHTHLNGGQGLVNVGPTGGFETGWLASDDSNVAPAQMSCGSATTWTSSASPQDSLPMNCVNWYEGYAFCIWDSGGFLPSDAELEYAAAGGLQQREYPWGSALPGSTNMYAIYGCNFDPASCYTVAAIAPVGTAAFGAGLWGQNDLAGNVWQWDLDYGAVPYVDPCIDCAFLTLTNERIVRGADFESDLSALLSSSSDDAPPTDRDVVYGFRCARSP